MEIKIFNTLGKEKIAFKPIAQGKVGIYSCGPTVYNYAHIGNLRAYVFSDILRRMFEFNNFEVKQIINITDVGHLSDDGDEGEDKMEKGAKREGKTVWDIARFYEGEFLKDMDLLNIIPATKYTRATEHIFDMIEMVKGLEKNNLTYVAGGNVYFDTSKIKDYGKLANLKLDEESIQSRVEKDPNKKNYFDFVLWFTNHKYANHAMMWDSPWGRGFPGWHIECSAMSSKYLGEHFDIHTGGIDHVPVHHTNEIAQAEGCFGHKWVNYWMHNEFLVVKDDEKMAKSAGNFLRLQSILDKGFSALDYRYFLLGTHYRKKIMFSWEAMEGARNSLKKLKNKIFELKKEEAEFSQEKFDVWNNKFTEQINDDLNTPNTLAVLWDLLNDSNTSSTTKLKLVGSFDSVLGLNLLKEELINIPDEIKELAEKRWKAKQEKNWDLSDSLRNDIKKSGYEILDSKDSYEIKKI